MSADTCQPLTYDERVEMLRLADDIAGGEIADLDTPQLRIVIRALRMAAGESASVNKV